jgi:hypothetical protein
MRNRRILERRNLIYYLQVVDRNSGELIGRLVDITVQGMMLVSEQALPTNQLFQLRMMLPSGATIEPYIDFEAQSVWCQHDLNPTFFNTGFKLLDVTPDIVTIVDDLVTDYGFPEVEHIGV